MSLLVVYLFTVRLINSLIELLMLAIRIMWALIAGTISLISALFTPSSEARLRQLGRRTNRRSRR